MKEYWWAYILYAIVCYFAANFNFSIFISNKVEHTDIRTVGSGNPGTTNMFRAFGLKAGFATFICDFMKGIICTLGGLLIFNAINQAGAENASEYAINSGLLGGYIGGLFAGIGHVFPVFYHFKGGKGFATGIGVFMVLDPIFAFVFLVIGFIVLLLTDRMSIFAILFFTLVTLQNAIILLPAKWFLFVIVALYYIMVLYAHRHNIIRLYHGTENPMGLRKVFKK